MMTRYSYLHRYTEAGLLKRPMQSFSKQQTKQINYLLDSLYNDLTHVSSGKHLTILAYMIGFKDKVTNRKNSWTMLQYAYYPQQRNT